MGKLLLFFASLITAFALDVQAQYQFPNSSFEIWNDTTAQPKAEGWGSHNDWLVTTGPSDWGLTRELGIVFAGNFSAELETKDILVFGVFPFDVPGIITNGFTGITSSIDSIFVTGGQPISDRPDELTGFWQYEPASGDSAMAWIQLFTNDGSGRNIIGEGMVKSGELMSAYQSFSVPITYSAMDDPDSVFVIISASHDLQAPVPGSKLWVDTLNLIYEDDPPIGIDEIFENNLLKIFPNPVSNVMNIEHTGTETVILEVLNLVGKTVRMTPLAPGLHQVGVSELSAGIYLYKVSQDEKIVQSGKIMIE